MPKVNLGVSPGRKACEAELKRQYGQVLTVLELAQVLKAERRTAEAWAEANGIRYTVIGTKSKRYPVGEIARALYG